MATFLAIVNLLVAIPKIGQLIEDAINGLIVWQIQRQNNENLAKIADAAALSSQAKTDEDRYAAAQSWQDALSRPRVTRD